MPAISWNWLRTVGPCPSPTLNASCPRRQTRRLHSPTAAPSLSANLEWSWSTPRSLPCHQQRRRRMPRLRTTQHIDNDPGKLSKNSCSNFKFCNLKFHSLLSLAWILSRNIFSFKLVHSWATSDWTVRRYWYSDDWGV